MSEALQIIFSIGILLVVWALAMLGTGWWTSKISQRIVKELENKGAFDEKTAVALPYEKVNHLRIGFRDYRPKALELLVTHDTVIRTAEGKYYLNRLSTL
ncbi:MAG TPA: hypothetical protein PKZ12_04130 [Smithellaceae bacterium]|nr:hypothetical protein [Smithellaceae bacterium]